MRKRIFEIIEKAEANDFWSNVYDYIMIVVIVFSLVPLAFKKDIGIFKIIDEITVCIFIKTSNS